MTEIALIPKPKKVRIRRGRRYIFASRTRVTLPPRAVITTPTGRYRMARRRTVTMPKGTRITIPKVTVPEVKPKISPWILLLLLGIAFPIFPYRR